MQAFHARNVQIQHLFAEVLAPTCYQEPYWTPASTRIQLYDLIEWVTLDALFWLKAHVAPQPHDAAGLVTPPPPDRPGDPAQISPVASQSLAPRMPPGSVGSAPLAMMGLDLRRICPLVYKRLERIIFWLLHAWHYTACIRTSSSRAGEDSAGDPMEP